MAAAQSMAAIAVAVSWVMNRLVKSSRLSVGVRVQVHSWVRMDVQMKARPR